MATYVDPQKAQSDIFGYQLDLIWLALQLCFMGLCTVVSGTMVALILRHPAELPMLVRLTLAAIPLLIALYSAGGVAMVLLGIYIRRTEIKYLKRKLGEVQ